MINNPGKEYIIITSTELPQVIYIIFFKYHNYIYKFKLFPFKCDILKAAALYINNTNIMVIIN